MVMRESSNFVKTKIDWIQRKCSIAAS